MRNVWLWYMWEYDLESTAKLQQSAIKEIKWRPEGLFDSQTIAKFLKSDLIL